MNNTHCLSRAFVVALTGAMLVLAGVATTSPAMAEITPVWYDNFEWDYPGDAPYYWNLYESGFGWFTSGGHAELVTGTSPGIHPGGTGWPTDGGPFLPQADPPDDPYKYWPDDGGENAQVYEIKGSTAFHDSWAFRTTSATGYAFDDGWRDPAQHETSLAQLSWKMKTGDSDNSDYRISLYDFSGVNMATYLRMKENLDPTSPDTSILGYWGGSGHVELKTDVADGTWYQFTMAFDLSETTNSDGSYTLSILDMDDPSATEEVFSDLPIDLGASMKALRTFGRLQFRSLNHDEDGTGASVDIQIDDVVLEERTVMLGDFDVDGDVDGADFLLWQRDTSIGELSDWQANFGAGGVGSPVVSAVPEPGSGLLLLVCGGLMAIRRKR